MRNEDFKSFYKKYYRFSVKIAHRIVKDLSTAEDIAQEMFYSLYRELERVETEDEKKLCALVRVATINKARDYLKSAYVSKVVAAEDNEELEVPASVDNSTEAAVLCMEENQYAKLVLQRLREENRTSYDILMKVKYLDIPPDTVAKEYGITVNNVNNRIMRAKRWIEKELSRLYSE